MNDFRELAKQKLMKIHLEYDIQLSSDTFKLKRLNKSLATYNLVATKNEWNADNGLESYTIYGELENIKRYIIEVYDVSRTEEYYEEMYFKNIRHAFKQKKEYKIKETHHKHDSKIVDINDMIITNAEDPLYNLQEKYNVKISRSNKSSAVYVFRQKSKFLLRVGHYITKSQPHLWNFQENYIVKGDVKYKDVEKAILKYKNRF